MFIGYTVRKNTLSSPDRGKSSVEQEETIINIIRNM